jgi:hypothetical protein
MARRPSHIADAISAIATGTAAQLRAGTDQAGTGLDSIVVSSARPIVCDASSMAASLKSGLGVIP